MSNVDFTLNAAKKVGDLMLSADEFDVCLRVSISGGGCSGFQYNFTFEQKILEDDMQFTQSYEGSDKITEVKLLIDPISFTYLQGATIDYIEDLQGARFVIKNPNAATTCGCGSSFSV